MRVEDERDEETLSIDALSAITRIDARRAIDGSAYLLRRPLEDVSDSFGVQTTLQKEIEFAEGVGHHLVLVPRLEPLLSGGAQLKYEMGAGRVIYNFIEELKANGSKLSFASALCVLNDMVEAIVAIQSYRRSESQKGLTSHGCLDLNKFLVNADGRTVLFDLRFPATGIVETLRYENLTFRAPEFVMTMTEGTPSMDVYTVGAMFMGLLFPETVLTEGRSFSCEDLLQSDDTLWIDDSLKNILSKAMRPKSQERYPDVIHMQQALQDVFTQYADEMNLSREELGALIRGSNEECLQYQHALNEMPGYENAPVAYMDTKQEISKIRADITDPAEHTSQDILKPLLEDAPVKDTARLQPIDDLPLVDAELIEEPATFAADDEEPTDLILEEKVNILFDKVPADASPLDLELEEGEDGSAELINDDAEVSGHDSHLEQLAVTAAVNQAVSLGEEPKTRTEQNAGDVDVDKPRKRRVNSVLGTPISSESPATKTQEVSPRVEHGETLQLDIAKTRTPTKNPLLTLNAQERSQRRLREEHLAVRTRHNRISAFVFALAAGAILWFWQTAPFPSADQGAKHNEAKTSVKFGVEVDKKSESRPAPIQRVAKPDFKLPAKAEPTVAKVRAEPEAESSLGVSVESSSDVAEVIEAGRPLGIWGGESEEAPLVAREETIVKSEPSASNTPGPEELEGEARTESKSDVLSKTDLSPVPQRTAGIGVAENIPRYQWGMAISDDNAAVGDLIVNVIPWGVVYVDGRRIGYPPVYVENLTVGSHVVRVERTGFKKLVRKVDIKAGEETSVHIHFRTESK